MIKFYFGEPAVYIVTIITFLALFAFMRILMLVAAITFYWDFFIQSVWMAFLAANFFVFA